MIVLSDSQVLIPALAASDASVVAIDGWPSSGKSCLGRAAAPLSGRRWLDLDDLLERQQAGFVEDINLNALREAVCGGEPLILSGACMREVLARVGGPKALHVYVKRMHLGYWTDEEEAEGRAEDLEAFPTDELEREVRAYHETWKPHLKAHYVYEREVNADGR